MKKASTKTRVTALFTAGLLVSSVFMTACSNAAQTNTGTENQANQQTEINAAIAELEENNVDSPYAPEKATVQNLIDNSWDDMNSDQRETCLTSLGKCEALDFARSYITQRLKSPKSYNEYKALVIHSYGGEQEDGGTTGESNYKIAIQYGATNSFGGEVTDSIGFSVDVKTDYNAKTATVTNYRTDTASIVTDEIERKSKY